MWLKCDPTIGIRAMGHDAVSQDDLLPQEPRHCVPISGIMTALLVSVLPLAMPVYLDVASGCIVMVSNAAG
jgi:hypothetical protein